MALENNKLSSSFNHISRARFTSAVNSPKDGERQWPRMIKYNMERNYLRV